MYRFYCTRVKYWQNTSTRIRRTPLITLRQNRQKFITCLPMPSTRNLTAHHLHHLTILPKLTRKRPIQRPRIRLRPTLRKPTRSRSTRLTPTQAKDTSSLPTKRRPTQRTLAHHRTWPQSIQKNIRMIITLA